MVNQHIFRGSVFISYRRSDVPGYVRALMSELRTLLGSQQVFFDMEDIDAGAHFPTIIDQAVGHCELLLIVIGPQWLQTCNERGRCRLEDEDDFVRLEIAAGLTRRIPIIPILLPGAKMPAAEQLPETLRELSDLQAVALSHEYWDDNIQSLLQAIERVTVEPQLARQYTTALDSLATGDWREALATLELIHALRPHYLDVAERLPALRESAQRTAALDPMLGRLRQAVSRHALPVMILLCLLPNVLAGWFNYAFNWEVIVKSMNHRGIAKADDYFQFAAMAINSIGFPVGAIVFIYLSLPVTRALKQMLDKDHNDFTPPAAVLRTRLLALGRYASWIGVVLWIVAGPAYPLMIGSMAAQDYIFFVSSLTVCGLLSAAYPFLTLTWLATRLFYLPFLLPGTVTHADVAELNALDNSKWRYLLMAGGLPMLVVAMGMVLGPGMGSDLPRVLLGGLGFAGCAGFMLSLWLFRAIQTNIDILRDAAVATAGTRLPPPGHVKSASTSNRVLPIGESRSRGEYV